MRKIIFQMMVSLDGYFEGPGRDIGWHNVDAEFNEYAIDLLNQVDTLIFGRVTYQLMKNYWPTDQALKDDPIVAERMNNLSKIVFSTTLENADWQNTRLIKDNLTEEIRGLKQKPGKDMAIFGSSDLALSFIENDLIDEYRIILNPTVLGEGKPLFVGIKDRLKLKLIKAQPMRSGNIVLYYDHINPGKD